MPKIVFTQAQAHTPDGTRSTIISQPVPESNPQFAVRAYEVETVTASGQHHNTVAIDIDASNPA